MSDKPPDEFRALVDRMKEGDACAIMDVGAEKHLLAVVPMSALKPRLLDPGIVGFLGDMLRPGVVYLQRFIELNYFRPCTPRNRLYELYILRWQGLDWGLTLFPRASLSPVLFVDAVARAGLVTTHGVPVAIDSRGPRLTEGSVPASGSAEWFAGGWVELDLPLDNVLCLENPAGHLVFRDPRAAQKRETEKLAELHRKFGLSESEDHP